MNIHSEVSLNWQDQAWGRSVALLPQATWQEVGPGQSWGPEKLAAGHELVVITLAGGAQVRLGERVLRPLAGQIMQRDAGDEMEIVNDTHQPLRLLRVQLPA